MTEGHDPDPPAGERPPVPPPPVVPAAPPSHMAAPLAAPRPDLAPPPQAAPASQAAPVTAPSAVTPAGRRRSAWRAVVALALVVVLVGAFAYQSLRLEQVSTDLAAAVELLEGLAQDQSYGDERLDALEERAGALERSAGEVFNPEAIATAVLPSVFKVIAGDFTGTAFAVGGAADDGGTNLFTNYHVVEQVWLAGDRGVSLERTNQRYAAEIVDADRSADVAWLHTTSSFNGLEPATDHVRTGQPIVSVGAPLGLGETLTTGVVSNTDRQLPDGSGPWIQFDAAVEPGNSGGPVINAGQQVVGITTRKAIDFEGIGFAVPIGEACELFDIC